MSETLASLDDDGVLEDLEIDRHGPLLRLRGHASTRAFYRCRRGNNGSAVLVVYPERDATAEVRRYIDAADWLRAAGVRVPVVYSHGPRALLVEDCGDVLLDQAEDDHRPRLYRQAVRAIQRLQQHGANQPSPNPTLVLDAERMHNELRFMETHALSGWLCATSGARARARLYADLSDRVASFPRTVCHRDFHARNLLVCDGRLVVIDFQDTMAGPLFYDAASLLLDNYVDVPREVLAASLARLRPRGAVAPGRDLAGPTWPPGLGAEARVQFLLTALQRSLKALGTFGYQVSVRGQSGYAAHVPRTWSHVRRALIELGWDEYLGPLSQFDRVA